MLAFRRIEVEAGAASNPHSGFVVTRVDEISERIIAGAAAVVTNDHDIGCSFSGVIVKRPPRVKNCINGPVWMNRRSNGGPILTRSNARLDPYRLESGISCSAIQRLVDGCSFSAGRVEIVVADINAIFSLPGPTLDRGSLDVRLIHAPSNTINQHFHRS